jgi:hypothetical protein
MRIDSLVHHIEKLALDFAPDFRSSSVGLLQKQYQKTWSSSFFQKWADATEFVFYTIDNEPIAPGEEGRPHPLTGERYWPGVMRRLLEDFATPAVRLITTRPDREVEIAWDLALRDFNNTCKSGGRCVMDDLAGEIQGIGVEFSE